MTATSGPGLLHPCPACLTPPEYPVKMKTKGKEEELFLKGKEMGLVRVSWQMGMTWTASK